MFVLPETDKKVDIHCGVAAMSACADLSFNHNMSLVKSTATSVLAVAAASRVVCAIDGCSCFSDCMGVTANDLDCLLDFMRCPACAAAAPCTPSP